MVLSWISATWKNSRRYPIQVTGATSVAHITQLQFARVACRRRARRLSLLRSPRPVFQPVQRRVQRRSTVVARRHLTTRLRTTHSDRLQQLTIRMTIFFVSQSFRIGEARKSQYEEKIIFLYNLDKLLIEGRRMSYSPYHFFILLPGPIR